MLGVLRAEYPQFEIEHVTLSDYEYPDGPQWIGTGGPGRTIPTWLV